MNPTQAPKVKVAQLHWTLCDPIDYQFMEFSGQSNGVGSPSPGTQALYILLAYTLSAQILWILSILYSELLDFSPPSTVGSLIPNTAISPLSTEQVQSD